MFDIFIFLGVVWLVIQLWPLVLIGGAIYIIGWGLLIGFVLITSSMGKPAPAPALVAKPAPAVYVQPKANNEASQGQTISIIAITALMTTFGIWYNKKESK